jgi:hypothetical protein
MGAPGKDRKRRGSVSSSSTDTSRELKKEKRERKKADEKQREKQREKDKKQDKKIEKTREHVEKKIHKVEDALEQKVAKKIHKAEDAIEHKVEAKLNKVEDAIENKVLKGLYQRLKYKFRRNGCLYVNGCDAFASVWDKCAAVVEAGEPIKFDGIGAVLNVDYKCGSGVFHICRDGMYSFLFSGLFDVSGAVGLAVNDVTVQSTITTFVGGQQSVIQGILPLKKGACVKLWNYDLSGGNVLVTSKQPYDAVNVKFSLERIAPWTKKFGGCCPLPPLPCYDSGSDWSKDSDKDSDSDCSSVTSYSSDSSDSTHKSKDKPKKPDTCKKPDDCKKPKRKHHKRHSRNSSRSSSRSSRSSRSSCSSRSSRSSGISTASRSSSEYSCDYKKKNCRKGRK